MNPLSFSALRLFLSVTVLICASFALAGCSRGVVRETAAETRIEKPKPPGSPMWLGNPERNFYGTGPLKMAHSGLSGKPRLILSKAACTKIRGAAPPGQGNLQLMVIGFTFPQRMATSIA